MRRRHFLAAGAATLAGCSGHGSNSPLPATPQGSSLGNASPATNASSGAVGAAAAAGGSFAYRLSSEVMASPIIGEAGVPPLNSTPSSMWALCDGRSVKIADNPLLYAVLGRSAGGDGKTYFKLPMATTGPYYIAVQGAQPSSPAVLAAWRKGKNAPVFMTSPTHFDGRLRVSPQLPSPQPWVAPATAQAVVPDPATISEHARFAQVLAELSLDANQRAAIVDLTDRARQAPTGAARRAAVEATMSAIVGNVLRDDQRTHVDNAMSAWRATRRNG